MTCGKKHCDAPTEATKVDPAEVEGRPLCDHAGCDQRVIGDGSKCAAGHGQGLAVLPEPEEDAVHVTGADEHFVVQLGLVDDESGDPPEERRAAQI